MAHQVGPAQIGYGYPNPQKSIFPDPIVSGRAPTTLDRAEVGQLWVWPAQNEVWVLSSIIANVSTWLLIQASGSNVPGVFSRIVLPATDAAGDGTISIGGSDFINALNDNTFVGILAGNLTETGTGNTGIGQLALASVTSGTNNTITGANSGQSITTGQFNNFFGKTSGILITTGSNNDGFGNSALSGLITGSNNIALGALSGSAYAAAESSNIVIGNVGVVSESHVIRIGTDGTGLGQQDLCIIAGDIIGARDITATENIVAAGDNGTGFAATTSLTNVTNTTQGVGARTILSTSGSSGTNAGFIKIYVGTTVAYIPYFTTI